MPVIPVAQFLPDAAALGNPGSVNIANAAPGTTSYKPFPSFVSATDATDERPRGATSVRDKDNNVFNYAGDASKLYVQSGTAWNDISKSGGYTTDDNEVWEFVQWKNQLFGTNFSDVPQEITLGGVQFADLTTDFRARHIAVVRDFTVVGNTFDSTDGNVPDRVRWCAFNDPTDWTVDPSTLADFRDLKSGGWVQRIMGGDYGVIVSERSTFRMSFAGAPTVFQIDETLPGVGTIAPGSVVRFGDTVYFWAEQGLAAVTNGTGVVFPGAGKWDRFIRSDLDESYLHRMSAIADPKNNIIVWAYPGAGNTAGQPNRMLIYDRSLDKASIIELDLELLWRGAGVGLTLEQLDSVDMNIDTLEPSLDSSFWKGGRPEFGAFNPDFESGFFSGAPMEARVETRESEIHAGFMTQMNAFRALVDGGTVTAQIGTRNKQTDSVTWSPVINQRASGRFTRRANARFFRFRLNLSDEWKDAIGVEIDPSDARRAGRRG